MWKTQQVITSVIYGENQDSGKVSEWPEVLYILSTKTEIRSHRENTPNLKSENPISLLIISMIGNISEVPRSEFPH